MDATIDLLQMGLDGAMKRQRAIANNIANVDTPGYKRKDVEFISVLKDEVKERRDNYSARSPKIDSPEKTDKLSLALTDKKHINSRKKTEKNFQFTTYDDGKYRNDRNNVDIDIEMGELAKTNIYYNTVAQRISGKFKALGKVIDKGGN